MRFLAITGGVAAPAISPPARLIPSPLLTFAS